MFGRSYFGTSYYGERYFGPRLPAADAITGVILVPFELEGFDEADTILVPFNLIGSLVVDKADTGAEGRFDDLGFRPSTCLLVYALNVLDVADITAVNVPADGHFLISAVFLNPPGNLLTESGAKAGDIGQRIVGTGGDIYSFRPPTPNEVVWFVDNTGSTVDTTDAPDEQFLLRFGSREVWQEYRSLPNRALDDQGAFEILDPDRVYEFYGKILGCTFAQWMFDNLTVLDMIDPDRVLARFIDLLALNFGADLPADDPITTKRRKIRNAVPIHKLKGLALSIVLRLRDLGFSGFSNEIWVNAANEFVLTNDPDGQLSGFDTITGIVVGTNTDVLGKMYLDVVDDGGGFFHLDFYSDGARTVLVAHTATYNSTGSQAVLPDSGSGLGGTLTINALGPANATLLLRVPTNFDDINNAPPVTQADAQARGIFDLIQVDNGQKGIDFFEAPHGFFTEDQDPYFLSSRLSIHLNEANGDPLPVASMSVAELDELKERVARELRRDILPIAVDIRQFITDFEVGPFSPEEIRVRDTMVITDVISGPVFGFMGGGSLTAQPAAGGFIGGGSNTGQPAAGGFVGGGSL